MTKLSVNINKIALVRNSRGGNMPNVERAALDIERFGGDGITIHPRPDARHIRYSDAFELKASISTELNIEGNPTEDFMAMVCQVRPAQVTLVPDAPDALTSSAGWNTITQSEFLSAICAQAKAAGVRCSIFVDPDAQMVRGAAACGADRVELYTEGYAAAYAADPKAAIAPYAAAAKAAAECGLGLNAGHDLNLDNLAYFVETIPNVDEVSIGHALVCDALYMGLENVVGLYQRELKNSK
ncbi:MAG: pyridoxine 5'-phosphate synthase [Rikenellaceae bacterium]